MAKLELYGGLPCSGKTKIIKNLKDQSFIHISSKDFRPDDFHYLSGQEAFDASIEAWHSALIMAEECLKNGDNVAFESAGYNVNGMRPLIKLADSTDYYFVVCPIAECKRRSDNFGYHWIGDSRVKDILLKLRTELPRLKFMVDNFYIIHNERQECFEDSVSKIDRVRESNAKLSTEKSGS